jgi:hypothetical protein
VDPSSAPSAPGSEFTLGEAGGHMHFGGQGRDVCKHRELQGGTPDPSWAMERRLAQRDHQDVAGSGCGAFRTEGQRRQTTLPMGTCGILSRRAV